MMLRHACLAESLVPAAAIPMALRSIANALALAAQARVPAPVAKLLWWRWFENKGISAA
jgi:hypothetical protein